MGALKIISCISFFNLLANKKNIPNKAQADYFTIIGLFKFSIWVA